MAAPAGLDWTRLVAKTARVKRHSPHPVVIIGAGLGGLSCAAYLAKAGFAVTVIEQHAIPGGYATAFSRRDDFIFEVSLHGTSIHNNSSARILTELGVLERLQLVPLPEVYRLKAKNYDLAVPQRDPEGYIRMLADLFPAEARGIRRFVKDSLTLNREVNDYCRRREFTKPLAKVLIPIKYPTMWRIRNKSLETLLKEYVQANDLINLLGGLWSYYGLPPSKLSAFYYTNATGDYLQNGSYYIRPRSQELSDALAAIILENGGRIIYNRKVASILLVKKAARAVAMADATTLTCRAVVSNASVLATMGKMLPAGSLPRSYRQRLGNYRPSISSFIVWLGLAQKVDTPARTFSTHVSCGNDPEEDYRACESGDVERGPFIVCNYDNIYPGYSKPGRTSIMILFLCGYQPWESFAGDYRRGRKMAYRKEKQRWADILVQRAEAAVIPGLGRLIAVQDAATPLTNERFTGSTKGAIYGFEQALNNAYLNRIPNRTPIKNLYLAGAWGFPGAGFTGVLLSGEMTFHTILKDWGC